MKKLYTFLVFIVACFTLSSCDDNNGSNGGSHHSDSQFVGFYMENPAEDFNNNPLDSWNRQLLDIIDTYYQLCEERDIYMSQGNWNKVDQLQDEIDMLLDESCLQRVTVIDISNGKFRYATAGIWLNYKSNENVYKRIYCDGSMNTSNRLNYTISFVIDEWNVLSYRVGDDGTYLIVGDYYIYLDKNDGTILWDGVKFYLVDDCFNFFM